jgi:hypothetical protein
MVGGGFAWYAPIATSVRFQHPSEELPDPYCILSPAQYFLNTTTKQISSIGELITLPSKQALLCSFQIAQQIAATPATCVFLRAGILGKPPEELGEGARASRCTNRYKFGFYACEEHVQDRLFFVAAGILYSQSILF